MKKVLKVFLVVMLAVTMLSQVAAFADCTYTTDTSYDLSTGKAKVTSTVYGIGAGEEVTFLVERLNTETSVDEILYIDQMNTSDYTASASGESASFTYLIPVEKADGTARVRFASSSNSASDVLPEDGGVGSLETPGTDDTVKLNNCKVTYKVVGNGAVAVADASEEMAYDSVSAETDAYQTSEIAFDFAPNPGWEIDSYQINGGEAQSIAGLPSTAITVNGDMEITFTFVEATKSDVAVAPTFAETQQTVDHNQSAAAVADRYVTMFASFEQNNDIIDYGILVSKEEIVTEGLDVKALSTMSNPVKKFQALGAFNGKYAVKLINGTADYLDGTLYVVPYAVAEGKDGVAKYSFGTATTVTYDEIAQ